MTVSTVLRARNFKDIIFVTDSVMEPKEGATVNYINRKCMKVRGNFQIYRYAIQTHTNYSGDISRLQIYVFGRAKHNSRQLLFSSQHTSLPGKCVEGASG